MRIARPFPEDPGTRKILLERSDPLGFRGGRQTLALRSPTDRAVPRSAPAWLISDQRSACDAACRLLSADHRAGKGGGCGEHIGMQLLTIPDCHSPHLFITGGCGAAKTSSFSLQLKEMEKRQRQPPNPPPPAFRFSISFRFSFFFRPVSFCLHAIIGSGCILSPL